MAKIKVELGKRIENLDYKDFTPRKGILGGAKIEGDIWKDILAKIKEKVFPDLDLNLKEQDVKISDDEISLAINLDEESYGISIYSKSSNQKIIDKFCGLLLELFNEKTVINGILEQGNKNKKLFYM